jgi:hypothetical protein
VRNGAQVFRGEFDGVFNSDAAQDAVYARVQLAVTHALDGINASVLAYGQTVIYCPIIFIFSVCMCMCVCMWVYACVSLQETQLNECANGFAQNFYSHGFQKPQIQNIARTSDSEHRTHLRFRTSHAPQIQNIARTSDSEQWHKPADAHTHAHSNRIPARRTQCWGRRGRSGCSQTAPYARTLASFRARWRTCFRRVPCLPLFACACASASLHVHVHVHVVNVCMETDTNAHREASMMRAYAYKLPLLRLTVLLYAHRRAHTSCSYVMLICYAAHADDA